MCVFHLVPPCPGLVIKGLWDSCVFSHLLLQWQHPLNVTKCLQEAHSYILNLLISWWSPSELLGLPKSAASTYGVGHYSTHLRNTRTCSIKIILPCRILVSIYRTITAVFAFFKASDLSPKQLKFILYFWNLAPLGQWWAAKLIQSICMWTWGEKAAPDSNIIVV